jgi:hypothetical protein
MLALVVQADFRVYVFAAYGAVILLLLLFNLWSAAQVGAAERRLEQVERRLQASEKAPGKTEG